MRGVGSEPCIIVVTSYRARALHTALLRCCAAVLTGAAAGVVQLWFHLSAAPRAWSGGDDVWSEYNNTTLWKINQMLLLLLLLLSVLV